MGLGAYENKFVGELSTGTDVWLTCLGVIAHRPLVVLLDEPSSGIAQKKQKSLSPSFIAFDKKWDHLW